MIDSLNYFSCGVADVSSGKAISGGFSTGCHWRSFLTIVVTILSRLSIVGGSPGSRRRLQFLSQTLILTLLGFFVYFSCQTSKLRFPTNDTKMIRSEIIGWAKLSEVLNELLSEP